MLEIVASRAADTTRYQFVRLGIVLVTVVLLAGILLPSGATAGQVWEGQNGSECQRNSECVSNYCANGQRCAPRDGTGRVGDYCHHNNHCSSGFCGCNKGAFGFCANWEEWPYGKFDVQVSHRYIEIGVCE